MSSNTLDEMIRQANSLTTDEKLRLAAYLLERARETYPLRPHYHKWREIRGLARTAPLPEDAQEWVSRTRREADEQRARQWNNKV